MSARMILRETMEVEALPEDVIPFFHDIRNLKGLLPRFPRLEIEGEGFSVAKGLCLTVTADLLLFRLRWLLRIVDTGPCGKFVDSLEGPLFAEWNHVHTFERHGSGTRISDVVEYVPAGWLAPFVPALVTLGFAARRRVIGNSLRRYLAGASEG